MFSLNDEPGAWILENCGDSYKSRYIPNASMEDVLKAVLEELKEQKEQGKRLLHLLKEIEWSGRTLGNADDTAACPFCGGIDHRRLGNQELRYAKRVRYQMGHRDNCELKQAIKELEK